MESNDLAAELKETDSLRWLMWSLREARVRRIPDNELVKLIGAENSRKTDPSILKEIDRRLTEWSAQNQRALVRALKQIHTETLQPGPPAQAVDRVLRRFLWKLSTRTARPLAHACLDSPRLQRRMAAWRYLSHHGIDATARTALIGRSDVETHKHFWQLVAHDAESIREIGVAPTLLAQKDSYWRGRVLETCLASGEDPAEAILLEYPWESLFAIRRAERNDLIPVAVRLFREHCFNPRVVSAAIQCFGFLNAERELAVAETEGLGLLRGSPALIREFLQIDQALTEIDRFGFNVSS